MLPNDRQYAVARDGETPGRARSINGRTRLTGNMPVRHVVFLDRIAVDARLCHHLVLAPADITRAVIEAAEASGVGSDEVWSIIRS